MAPIVEAAVHWRARAGRQLDEGELRAKLAELLPDYPSQEPQRHFALEFLTTFSENEPQHITKRHDGWLGFRLTSEDKKSVAQFSRDGLVFSRLKPYEDWNHFAAEARRLWRMFVDFASPEEIQRLGVRFINRMEGCTPDNLKEYLKDPPTCPSSLPLIEFLYQSTFNVPGHSLGVRIVKTLQSECQGLTVEMGLLLDVDVFTTNPISCDDGTMDAILPKMRWLKNRTFFGLLTQSAIDRFKGE